MEGNKKKNKFWRNGVVLIVYVKSTNFGIFLGPLGILKRDIVQQNGTKFHFFLQYFIVFDLNLASVRPI